MSSDLRGAAVSEAANWGPMVGSAGTAPRLTQAQTQPVICDDYESLPTNSVVIHMTAGAFAGVAEHTVMYPLDCIKTRMQSMVVTPQHHGIIRMFQHMVAKEGIRAPFRGIGVVMCGAGPAHALYFASYEKLKGMFEDQTAYKSLVHGASGAVATLLHDAFMNPVDVVKQRLQMHSSPYSNAGDCARRILQKEGFRAFYRSYSTQLTMNIPFQSTNFMVYEAVRSRMNPEGYYNPQVHMLAGGLAGGIAAIVTNPLDVAKTVLNTQEEAHICHRRAHLRGMSTALKRIYDAHGMAGYMRGVRPRFLHQAPAAAICWSVYELFKSLLGLHPENAVDLAATPANPIKQNV
ncbi:mitoferrin-like [Sycon ciliatum]|uniref:mitoferrin-like n=1 Tax=Sycon ciliatum TaxID=27933 RepID=UPI0020AA88C0|eukprot:scpid41788/ scgid22645/ Mitoferrin